MALDIFGGVASIALGARGIQSDPGDGLNVASNSLGIASGVASLGAVALGFTTASAFAPPLAAFAFGLGLTGFLLGSAGLFTSSGPVDHLGNFVHGFDHYGVTETEAQLQAQTQQDAAQSTRTPPAQGANPVDLLFGEV